MESWYLRPDKLLKINKICQIYVGNASNVKVLFIIFGHVRKLRNIVTIFVF